jgi:hypothetical protein
MGSEVRVWRPSVKNMPGSPTFVGAPQGDPEITESNSNLAPLIIHKILFSQEKYCYIISVMG